MRQFNTLTGFLLSKSSNPTIDDTVEFQGYDEIGDGGAGTWQHNGVTGQTPSQSPAQLGGALLNDASGNQWAYITSGFISVKAMGLSEIGTAANNTLSIQAAINSAKIIKETFVVNKISTVTASVYLGSGIFEHEELNTYTGVKFIGESIGSTTLKFVGTTGNAINIIKVATEEMFGVDFEDFTMVNESVSGTPRGISGDEGQSNLAIRMCSLNRVVILSFDINLYLDNCFTFRINHCLLSFSGKNNAVLKNATGSGAGWTRFDVSGEDNVIVEDGTFDLESVVCTFNKCTFQSSTHWGLLGIDVLTMRVIDCFFEANNQDVVQDFGGIYLSDGPNNRGQHYEIRGCFFSPGSGSSGQTAIKVDRAEFLETSNLIRGSNINVGLELGDNVAVCVDKNIYINQSNNVQYNDSTTKLFSLNSTVGGAPAFFGNGIDVNSYDVADATLIVGKQTSGHALIGAFDGIGGIQGAGSGSNFNLELNPVDGYLKMSAKVQRRAEQTGNYAVLKNKPMLIATNTSAGQNFDVRLLTPGDGGEFSFYKINDGSTINVIPDTNDSINGSAQGVTFIVASGAGSQGYYKVIGAKANDWRVVFSVQS